jgi:poly-gamma-glutamate synthesis protein (capsule biosynthesis protein)
MELTLTAVGDVMITRPLRDQQAPHLLALRDVVRDADAGFVNLEIMPHRFEGPPSVESGGAWLCCDPALVDELRWMGFTLFSCANNHSYDYGREGLLAALRHLDAMRVSYAGIGPHLAAARAPRYAETAAGRIALIAASSTFPTEAAAGPQRGDMVGRAGLNPLRYRRTLRVGEEDLARLRAVSERLGLSAARAQQVRDGWAEPDAETVNLFGQRFAVGEPHGEHTEPDERDLEGHERAVREARRQADWVIVSLHAHEAPPGRREKPAAFIQTFARACIDAGANAVLGHGPHVLRGIEYHRGRPILYSLSNFLFGTETMTAQPAEYYEQFGLGPDAGPADLFDARNEKGRHGLRSDPAFWRSVIARLTLRDDGTSTVSLVPVVMASGEKRTRRGHPAPATPAEAAEIMTHLDQLSRPFGAAVRERGGMWHVDALPAGERTPA